MEAVLIYCVFWVLPGILAGVLARRKGHDFTLFFVTGLVFSILAPIFVAAVLHDGSDR